MRRWALLLIAFAVPLFGADVAEPTFTPETLVLGCSGGPQCVDTETSVWRQPECRVYDFDTALIENARHGDRSAIELLTLRYPTMHNWSERHRIAAALLGRARDDAPMWKELETHARNAIRFLGATGERKEQYVAWCRAHEYDPDEYNFAALNAFDLAATDPRSRPFLLLALDSEEPSIVSSAIVGLATQHDASALPAIERALDRSKDAGIAYLLALYGSDAADGVAMKYIGELETEYKLWRHDHPDGVEPPER
jgi:hypothetical protein